MIASPPLFKNKKEFIIVVLFLVSIIVGRLAWIYQDYKKLVNSPSYYTKAQIEKLYNKKKSNKRLLKLRSKEGFYFYLYTDKKSLNRYNWVLVDIKNSKNLSFFNYLRGFFANGEIKEVLDKGFNQKWLIKERINNQHKSPEIKEFYNAIYLAEPINKGLREKISSLGVSHLVALSGFHLGILWVFIFGVLYFPYRFLQKRFFPWRHRGIDLGFFALFVLYLYVIFVGSPPALIRAYVMILMGWLALRVGVEIVSFRLLAIVLLVILVIQPRLIVSLGLLFSIAGVFYIFLILKWLKEMPTWFITLIAIPFGLFLLMFPLGHYFFPNTTIWQLTSPILSLLFIPFYPIMAIAHSLNFGDILDKPLIWLLSLPKNGTEITILNALMALYAILTFVSIFNKKAFYTLLVLASAITIYSLSISL